MKAMEHGARTPKSTFVPGIESFDSPPHADVDIVDGRRGPVRGYGLRRIEILEKVPPFVENPVVETDQLTEPPAQRLPLGDSEQKPPCLSRRTLARDESHPLGGDVLVTGVVQVVFVIANIPIQIAIRFRIHDVSF